MVSKPIPATITTSFMLTLLSFAAPALAASPTDLCPNGNITTVRVDKIIPSGSMAGFQKAVADHAKWYADHGFNADMIMSAPVLVYDEANKTMVKAPDQMMTVHMNSSLVPRDKHDAAWDAYVAEYKANSEITSETMACLPK
jgi:hypothetical protein